jgi:hypothetical protein
MSRFTFEHAKSYGRHLIDVKGRCGIPAEHRAVLYDAMKGLETQERLLVTLFFMADLPVEEHTYDGIEANLRQIFPPIGKQRLKPDRFKKFRETCITSVLKGNSAFFVNPKRGRWMNSDEGNSAAINVLRKENVMMNLVKKS